MAKAKSPIPEGFHTVTPQLILDNAAQAIDWYKKAFGAEEVSRAKGPDGKILHADLKIGNSHIMMNDAMGGAKGPKALGGSPMSLWVYVEDCDAMFNRAVSAGAKALPGMGKMQDALFNRAVGAGAQVEPGPMGQISDQFWGDRCGTLNDPHGYRWTIATRKEDLTPQEMKERQDEWMKQMAPQPTHG